MIYYDNVEYFRRCIENVNYVIISSLNINLGITTKLFLIQ